MDKQQHLKSFEKFYFLFNKELDDDLKKVENIEDSVKKYREVFRMVDKYKLQESNMSEHYSAAVNLGSVDDKYFSAFQGYSKKVRQLEKTKSELAKNDEVKKKIEEWKNCGNTIYDTNAKPNSNRNEEVYYCDKCLEKKSGRYLCHKTKNDNYKFCSTNCYNEHYGEYCSKCVNENRNYTKHLDIIHNGDNSYCPPCYQLVKQKQPDQEWNPTIYCRYCSAKSELFDVCDKQECLAKMNKAIKNKKINNSDINNLQERERERATSISTITTTFSNHEFRAKSY